MGDNGFDWYCSSGDRKKETFKGALGRILVRLRDWFEKAT